jgi:hypothetical protein
MPGGACSIGYELWVDSETPFDFESRVFGWGRRRSGSLVAAVARNMNDQPGNSLSIEEAES